MKTLLKTIKPQGPLDRAAWHCLKLQTLAGDIKALARDLEAGKPVSPKRLKKLAGQVHWWAERGFQDAMGSIVTKAA